MGKEFVDGCNQARAKYLPMELDHNLSKEEKEKAMAEWWQTTQNLTKKRKPTKNTIRVFINGKNRKQFHLLAFIFETDALSF